MLHLEKQAPDFSNITAYKKGGFVKINLSDYKGKWLILFFYPRDFTYVCPTEIREFAKHQEDFKKLNAEILGASTDSELSHKVWLELELPEVEYPILADTTQNLSKLYDVYNEIQGQAERGLFIINPDGVIKYALISSNTVGRSIKETLRVLEAIQTGDLCPAEWAHGEKTIGKAT
jgi:alkyl hydroperoxide reductase subunit AhpC